MNWSQVKLHEFQEGTQQQKSFFVELWDVGGSHSQRNTRHVFFHTVHGIILVHDLANRKSCHNLGRWLAEVMTFYNHMKYMSALINLRFQGNPC